MGLVLQTRHFFAWFLVCSIYCFTHGNVIPEDGFHASDGTTDERQGIRMCLPNTIFSASVAIPTLFVKESEGFEYLLTDYFLNDDLVKCKDGKSPSESGTTNTLQEFATIFQQVDTTSRVQHRTTVILETGWLAVGNGANYTSYYSPNEYCVKSIESDSHDARVQVKICQQEERQTKKPIFLRKCCPFGMVLSASSSNNVNESFCVGYNDKEKNSYPWYPSFINEAKLKPVDHHVEHNYRYEFPQCLPGQAITVQVDDGCLEEFHPVTNGRVAYLGADWSWKYFEDEDRLCFDKQLVDGTAKRVLLVCQEEAAEEDWVTDYIVHLVFMYIGASFYLLTSIIHMLTWSRQNLHGRTLCCCTSSLFCMQTVYGTGYLLALFGIGGSRHCVFQAMTDHFFTTASFTWLLMLNVNLWRTFSSVSADTGKNDRRFIVYSCIAWGFPLAVVLTSFALDQVFTCRTSKFPIPEYGREDYCFVSPHSQGYYVYYLFGTLILLSSIFATATLVSLYRFKRRRAGLKVGSRDQDKQTILLFLKLLLVMGLGWAIEVIAWAVTSTEDNYSHPIWIVADAYNVLSPVLIFCIFGLNSTTLGHLEQVHPIFKGIASRLTKVKARFRMMNSSTAQPNTESTDPL